MLYMTIIQANKQTIHDPSSSILQLQRHKCILLIDNNPVLFVSMATVLDMTNSMKHFIWKQKI